MACYLVEEFVESEPTGRSWRVTAASRRAALLAAIDEETRKMPGYPPSYARVTQRNRFGKSEFLRAPIHSSGRLPEGRRA